MWLASRFDKIAPHALPAHTMRVDHTPCNSTPEERNALSDLELRLRCCCWAFEAGEGQWIDPVLAESEWEEEMMSVDHILLPVQVGAQAQTQAQAQSQAQAQRQQLQADRRLARCHPRLLAPKGKRRWMGVAVCSIRKVGISP